MTRLKGNENRIDVLYLNEIKTKSQEPSVINVVRLVMLTITSYFAKAESLKFYLYYTQGRRQKFLGP